MSQNLGRIPSTQVYLQMDGQKGQAATVYTSFESEM